MCGIVGYIGTQQAAPLLTLGLSKLEYRGYDSAGIAVADAAGEASMRRAVGKLRNLQHSLDSAPLAGRAGIGHTRWATHGAPSEINSHPHRDATGTVFVVHNGIIENYAEIRVELEAQGVEFRSQTDTEVLPNLIKRAYDECQNLPRAIRSALQGVRGAYALAVMHSAVPDTVVAVRQTSPLVIGLGEGENFCASDALAILSETRRIIFLDNGEMAFLRAEGVEVFDLESGARRQKEVQQLDWSADSANKGDFPHFMLKEVHEQPAVMERLLHHYADEEKGCIAFPHIGLSREELRGVRRIFIQACGTSWHAGLVGKLLIERLGLISVDVDTSSEFRYRNVAPHTGGAILDSDTLVIAISQSGETADTLAGVQEAKERGLKVISVVNMPASSIVRASDGVIYTHAGPEVSVASTKAYIGQIGALYLLSLYLGEIHGLIDRARMKRRLEKFAEVPRLMREILADDSGIQRAAQRFWLAEHAFFIGRGYGQPSALEGALKLKEISYIHAEGYAAGELKHGPIALIDEKMPVVAIATQGVTYEKILSNMQEVRARGGKLIAVAGEDDEEVGKYADFVLRVPELTESFTPFVVALPMQLLAYHIAVLRDYDVDMPRNLAKSVTVE
ncbi:MAG: glutamine--fructose-6-phosphate transaminase (isomerizing) [Armatimonadetes bacterium]|nr:glutamine--fructose-6-phosphate transaminase (isomerizing) [Armatimonadota bacterium]